MTSAQKIMRLMGDALSALSNPRAMSLAETAPRMTLAGPFDSLIVATRCISPVKRTRFRRLSRPTARSSGAWGPTVSSAYPRPRPTEISASGSPGRSLRIAADPGAGQRVGDLLEQTFQAEGTFDPVANGPSVVGYK
jgi:hypothetical protein